MLYGDYGILPLVIVLLQREGRISSRGLKLQFHLQDDALAAIKDELIYARRLAVDEDGRVLVWTGGTHTALHPPASATATGMDTPLLMSSASPLPPDVPTAAAPDGIATASTPAPSLPEAERRQLTVMFCDLVGSTDLSGRFDPEDLREVVRAYQGTAATVIQRYEGHIAQYLGDGLLVYFGYPRAHGDEARRAVHTGLGLVAALETLNHQLQTKYGVQLAVRIGIHTGAVVVGQMGGSGRHEHLALGETPNIAARLEGLAPPNTVVISPVTARLVANTFALETMGPQALKGVPDPMEIWRVCGRRDAHQERLGSPMPEDGTLLLVGRDEELGLLRRRWAQSQEGLGQVALITGEAGIGKSSLVNVLRDQVAQEGRPRITFRCSPYHTNSALYPVITHLHQLLQFEREDAPDVRLAKVEGGLAPYTLPVENVVPLLAALLSVPLPEGRYPALSLSPQQQRQQTLDALNAWLLAEAERQPILVLWEDLHWADPTTLELLGLLVGQTPTASLLNVLTFRPEFVPPWPSRSHMTPLTLNRLERPQVGHSSPAWPGISACRPRWWRTLSPTPMASPCMSKS
jgi:class 3 adenylate cyclase